MIKLFKILYDVFMIFWAVFSVYGIHRVMVTKKDHATLFVVLSVMFVLFVLRG